MSPLTNKDGNFVTECPVCGQSWQGAEIPKEHRHNYGGETHFSLLVGVEYAYDSPNHFDGISEWMCPHCKTRWGRWSHEILQEGESEPRYGGRR